MFNGDVLLVKTGSSYGKCALVKGLSQEAAITPQFVVLKYIFIDNQFLTFVLQSQYARKNYDSFVLGSVIPTFAQVVFRDMKIPLLSIAEQQRIVEEIGRWFSLIDQIEQDKANLQETSY